MPKIKTLVLGAAVFTAAFFAYSNTLKNGFCWDDHILIESNAFLAEPHALKTLVEQIDLAPVVPILSAARPIFLASLVIDHRIWGDGPFGYHLTSVILHGLNAVLVWRAGLLFLNPDAALISGLVFAVHPINTEAVNMPSFRPDLLAVLFMLLALMAYRRMESAPEPGSAGAAMAAAGMAYALGAFSKETALVLPAAALWFDFCFLERPWRAKFWRRLAAMILFGYLALYYWHFRSGRSGYQSISSQATPAVMAIRDDAALAQSPSPREVVLNPSTPQWDALYHWPELNFRTMCVVFADYARLMIIPYPLRADRAPPLISSWADWRFLAALALFLLLLAAGARAYALGARPLPWGLGWWLIVLLPASNIVRLYNPMAERYLYPAAVGFAWIAGWAASLAIARAGRSGPKLKLFVLLAAGSVLALLSSMTRARNNEWKNDAVLFGREAALGSKNARIYYNLGFMAQAQGNLGKAEQDYKTAIALNPRYIEAMNNLAGLQEIKGESRRALKLYSEAARLNPGNSIPYDSLGAALAKKGQVAAALAIYHKALQENPTDTAAQISMAKLLEKTGRPDLAAYQLQEAVRKKPRDFAASFALTALLDKQGEALEAAKVWLSFLAASPQDARAMMNLGVEYDHAADCPKALFWLRRSVSRNPSDAAARYNLGMAQMRCGHPREAEKSLEKALSLDQSYSDAAYNLAVIEQQAGRAGKAIALYRQTLSNDPRKIAALNNLGGLYLQRGDLPQAQDYLSRGLALFPLNPSLLNNMGNVYLQEGNLNEAIGSYQKAIANSPAPRLNQNLAPTWTNLGICYYRQGRLAEAEKAWREAIADFPGYRAAYEWLSRAYRQSGRSAEAAALMRRLNSQAPAPRARP